MKYIITLISIATTTIACSQTINIKDKITTQNAHLITEFDENDIESMVTYYFASRIRKDEKWREVLPESTKWSSRMKYSIEEHDKWNFLDFKNLGFYTGKYGSSYVKVHFTIEYKGRRDDGTDEVELKKENGKWIISKVPI